MYKKPDVFGWSKRHFSVIFGLFVLLGFAFNPLDSVTAQENDLVIWLTPTEGEFFRTGNELPSAQDITLFFDNLNFFFLNEYGEQISNQVRVGDVRTKAFLNTNFAGQVLGQKMIFRELSRFVNERGFSGTITVWFYDWEELFDVLENLPVGKLEILPHITVAPSTWIAHLASKGIFIPLDAVIDTSVYISQALETCQVRQLFSQFNLGNDVTKPLLRLFNLNIGHPKQYALPWLVDLRFLFYWRDLFLGTNFEDREHFEAALHIAIVNQSRNNIRIPPFVLPVEADWDLLHTLSMLLWEAGGDWMKWWNFLPKEASDDVLSFLRRLRMNGVASFRRVKRTSLEQEFLVRKAGSILSGPWMLKRLEEFLGEDWYTQVGIEMPPFNVNSEKVTYLGGVHLSLTPRAEGNQKAKELIEYLTDDAADRYVTDLRLIPGSKEAFENLLASFPESSGVRPILQTAMIQGKYFPRIEEWAPFVEVTGTRTELFYLFKHIGENLPKEIVQSDLQAFRRRLNWQFYWTPFWQITIPIILILLLATIKLWFGRLSRMIKRIIQLIKSKYHHFTVHIIGENGVYQVRSVDWPRRPERVLACEEVNVPPEWFKEIAQYKNQLNSEKGFDNDNLDQLEDLGKKLSSIALPAKVSELFSKSLNKAEKQGKCLRLCLYIEPKELNLLPWEYLYFNRDNRQLTTTHGDEWMRAFFLGLIPSISIVRIPELKRKIKVKKIKRLKILIAIADSWNDLANAKREAQIIKNAFEGETNKVEVQILEKTNVKSLNFNIKNGNFDILHLIMHGFHKERVEDDDYPADIPIGAGVILEKDEEPKYEFLMAEDLAKMLESSSVRLVVLPVCKIGTAEVLAKSNKSKHTVPAVIGSRFKFPESCGPIFCKSFYDSFAAHRPLDECVSLSRDFLFAHMVREIPAWGFINVFLNTPNTNLWPI